MTELHQKANKFLNGELSYNVGVSVFLQLSRNENLKRLFLLPHSPERELQLRKQLHEITKQYEANHQGHTPRSSNDDKASERLRIADEPQEFHNIQKDNPLPDRYSYLPNGSDVPGLDSKLQKQRKELYRQRGHYHAQLHTARTDDERHQLAIKVMDAQDQINKLNRDIKLIEAGSIPSKYLKKDKTADEFVRIKNLKMYISRFEKKIESCTSLLEKTKAEAILIKHKAELKSLT